MSSSSMPIPARRANASSSAGAGATASSSYSSISSSSSSSAMSSPIGNSSLSSSLSTPPSSGKGKAPVTAAAVERIAPRRPSLLGSSLSKSEHIVVDLAPHSDGPPRLVTCVKSSQGFDWNQELFLPSYADDEGQDLELKQDPVQDIILTDEEAEAMMP